jgi:ligand-binding sensor domain-containing protein
MKYSRSLYIVFILSMSFAFGHAQQLSVQQYTVQEGLASNTVYDIYQDSIGYLWVGTEKSLCRFDGQTFKNYRSADQNSLDATKISEDYKGRIWFSNFRQQLFYLEADSLILFSIMDSLKHYQDLGILEKPKAEKYGESFLEYDIAQKQYLWVGTTLGIYCYNLRSKNWFQLDLESYKAEDFSPFIDFFRLDPIDNTLYFFLNQNDFYKYDISKKKLIRLHCDSCHKHFNYNINSPLRFASNSKRKLFIESWGVNQGLVEFSFFELKNDSFYLLNKLNSKVNTRPVGVFESPDQTLWIYTYNGIYQIDPQSGDLSIFFPKEVISKIIQDHEGNYWFSSTNSGLFMMPSEGIIQYQYKLEDNSVYKIDKLTALEQSQLLLAASNSKEHYIIDSKFPAQPIKEKVHTNITEEIEFLYYDSLHKKLYLEQGFLNIYDQEFKLIPSPAIGQSINIKPYKVKNEIILNNGIRSINRIDEEYLLIGGKFGASVIRNDGKLMSESERKHYRLGTKTFIKDNIKANFFYFKKIISARTTYRLSKEKYLIAYIDGLFSFDLQKGLVEIFDSEGNSVTNINNITQTADGRVWLSSTAQGLLEYRNAIVTPLKSIPFLKNIDIKLVRADGNDLWAATTNTLFHIKPNLAEVLSYSKNDGLEVEEIKDFIIKNDQIWLVSHKGLINFRKGLPSKNKVAAPIRLEAIYINDRDTLLSPKYHLSYKQNDITIAFHAICFRCFGEQSYRYQMKGLSDKWRDLDGTQQEIRFNSLPPNHYQLTIYAVNEDGVESEHPIVLDFHIAAPYWQTWWFRGLVSLLIFSFLAWQLWLMRRRHRMQLYINQLRNQALQSQMNPHFIFNALNAIQRLMLHSSTEEAMGYLTKFAKLIRQIFEISSLPSISLEKEEEFLRLYLDLEKLRFKEKVDIQFEIDPALGDDFHEIPPLLVQPVIENSFKHGLLHKEGQGHLLVKFEKEEDFLHILVEDDGIGRQAAAQYSQSKKADRKSGLSLTQDRLAMLAKYPKVPENYRVTDLKDEAGKGIGTKTELWIKLDFNA